jgi:hypothetical protein
VGIGVSVRVWVGGTVLGVEGIWQPESKTTPIKIDIILYNDSIPQMIRQGVYV